MRAVDPNHLISTPNDVSLEEAVKAFDGKFDVFWCEDLHCYDLLTTKMPLGTMDFEFITARWIARYRCMAPCHPPRRRLGASSKSGTRSSAIAGWISASAIGTAWRFLTKPGQIKNYGFLANGNEYNLDANGVDAVGCWFLISSRGGGTGLISEVDPVTAPLHYRRNGFGNFGPRKPSGVSATTRRKRSAAAWKRGCTAAYRSVRRMAITHVSAPTGGSGVITAGRMPWSATTGAW